MRIQEHQFVTFESMEISRLHITGLKWAPRVNGCFSCGLLYRQRQCEMPRETTALKLGFQETLTFIFLS